MGKIKTRPFGSDIAALLENMLAQDFTQSRLKQVGRRVQADHFFRMIRQSASKFLFASGTGKLLMLALFALKPRAINVRAPLFGKLFRDFYRETVRLIKHRSARAGNHLPVQICRIALTHFPMSCGTYPLLQ